MPNNSGNNRGAPSDIERAVMRRVYTISLLRLLVSPGAIAAVVCVAALWGIGREVWVARIIENAPAANDLFSLGRFYLAAFGNTHLTVQVLTLATLASMIYLVREAAKPLANVLVAPLKVRA